MTAGDPILSPAVTRRLLDRVTAESGAHDRARTALRVRSPREHEVAVAVAHGRSNAEIATGLGMTVATVKAHVSHLLTKLDMGQPRPGRVARARRRAGLTASSLPSPDARGRLRPSTTGRD